MRKKEQTRGTDNELVLVGERSVVEVRNENEDFS